MKFLFAGGGTAGHIYPSIAVAEELRARDSKNEILFIGRQDGNENSIIKKAGFDYRTVEVYGIPKKINFDGLKRIFTTLESPRSARKIIRDFSPDVIFATGGYVSYPCLRAGIKEKIPTVIHESNAYPGRVTRLLYKKCSSVLLNLDGAKKHLSSHKNIKTVGIPLRCEFTNESRASARRKLNLSDEDFLIVSFGGSGGSQILNSSVIELMKSYSQKNRRIKHIHATGKRYFENAMKFEAELCRGKSGCKIVPYIDGMPTYLLAADLVISRCGAVTLSELAAVGAPSILIPSPNVSEDHQRKNAIFLAQDGAAIMIDEEDLSERALLDATNSLFTDEEKRNRLTERISKYGRTDAKRIITDELIRLAKGKQNDNLK